jgi:hypothetical protein
MTTNEERPVDPGVPEPPPDEPTEPVADDSVLADAPDTTTGKDQLLQDEEGRPGSGV